MEHTDYLSLIEGNAAAMVATLENRPQAEIPSCPGWNGNDLLAHLANVLAQKLPVFRQRLTSPPERSSWERSAPTDQGLGPRVVALAGEVVEQLAAMGPTAPLWSWYERDQSSGFWARRLAHEAVIHRIDAELAAGARPGCSPEVGADGVGELLEVFLARPGRPLSDQGARAEIQLHGTDQPCDWVVTLGGDDILVREGSSADPAGRITGPAADLYLFGWGRRGPENLSIDGDPALPGRLRALAARAT